MFRCVLALLELQIPQNTPDYLNNPLILTIDENMIKELLIRALCQL